MTCCDPAPTPRSTCSEAEGTPAASHCADHARHGVWRLTIYRRRLPDHPVRRAAPAAAHGGRGGGRAPVRVRRAVDGDSRSGSTTSGWPHRSRRPTGPMHPEQVEEPVRGRARRAVARGRRRRRVQRPGARAQPDLARRWSCCAPTPSTCGRRASPSARTTSSGSSTSTWPSSGCSSGCSSPGSTRPPAGGEAERSEAITEEIRGQLDEVAVPGPRPDPPQLPGADPGHPADHLLPGRA